MKYYRSKSTSFIQIVIGAILISNAIIMPFEDKLILFYGQLLVGSLSLIIGFYDLRNYAVNIEIDTLEINPGIGIGTKFFQKKDIKEAEMKGLHLLYLVTKEGVRHRFNIRLSRKEQKKFIDELTTWLS